MTLQSVINELHQQLRPEQSLIISVAMQASFFFGMFSAWFIFGRRRKP